MPHRLQWRISFSVVTLLTVVFLALGVYLVTLLRDQQLRSLEAQLQSEANLVATAALGRLAVDGPAALDPLAKQLGRDADLRITLIGIEIGRAHV